MQGSLCITDYGVGVATGTSSQTLLLACMADLPLLSTAEELVLIDDASGEMHRPVLLRYADTPELLVDSALEFLQEKAYSLNPVLLVLPDSHQPQYAPLLESLRPLLSQPQLICIQNSQLETVFKDQLLKLEQQAIESLTLFALDSQTNLNALSASLQKGHLRTQHLNDGRAAGEGYGWFTLKQVKPEESAGVQLLATSWAEEPPLAEKASKEYQGLARSLAKLDATYPIQPGFTWIASRRQTAEDDLEAFMAYQYQWGNRTYKHLEQLCPARTLGDLGIAALPVSIALACQRLHFTALPQTAVIVSHSQVNNKHFSLLLSQPSQQRTSS